MKNGIFLGKNYCISFHKPYYYSFRNIEYSLYSAKYSLDLAK